MDQAEFRRLRNSDTWHFNPDCSHWPVAGYRPYKGENDEPGDGEKCDECMAKAGDEPKPKKKAKKSK